MYLVIVNKNNIPQEIVFVTPDLEKAQRHFLDTCADHLSNWDDYTPNDKDALLDLGYEQTGTGAIVLIDTSNCVTDDELRNQLTKPDGVSKVVSDGEIPFTCPKCDGHRITETMVDMVVHSEIVVSENAVDEALDSGGVTARYGDQTNEDGHVEYYQCADCGYVIVDHNSPHSEDGLDASALAKALKHLNADAPTEGVSLITHAELVKRFADALGVTEGEGMARIWNDSSPNQVRYMGDSMYEWVEG